jgi:CHAT domain-containing protein/Tfp pilus assembly protein PilF
MIAIIVVLALVIPLRLTGQDRKEVAELQRLATTGPDSTLIERMRHRSDEAREAVHELLKEAAAGSSDPSQAQSLAAAERLAGAVAVAWRDSFPLRQVARFRRLPPAQRKITVEADSLLQAGRAAFGAEGHEMAMRLLRDALHRFEALADTSGIAGTVYRLGGTGFYNIQEYDSAVAYLTRAGDLAGRIGDLRVAGRVLSRLGQIHWKQGDLRSAEDSLARARQVLERVGDGTGLRSTQVALALVAKDQGDLAAARRQYEAALAASRGAGDTALALVILNNLGVLSSREGNYTESTARYREALSIYRERGEQANVAFVLQNLAGVASRLSDYPQTVALLSEAAGILRRVGPGEGLNESDARVQIAEALMMMGRLQQADEELDRAEALLRRPGGTGQEAQFANLALIRGRLALALNRLAEAERQFARSSRFAAQAADAGDRAQYRQLADMEMADLLMKRGSNRRAQLTLEPLLRERSVDMHNKAMVRAQLSQAAWQSGDTATARRVVREVLDTMRALGDVRSEARLLTRLGDLELRSGRLLAAESLYRRGLTRLEKGPAPEVTWQLRAGLAASLRRRGKLAEAMSELRAGIGEIEQVAGGLELEEQRSAFQSDKWDVYVDLALVENQRGRTETAFETSERLRARQMLDLLARGRVGQQGALGELAAREQDLRRRIGELAMESRDIQPAEPTQAVRDRASADEASGQASRELAELREDYGKLLREIRSADPSYAGLVRGETVAARTVMAALGPDEALLEYLVGDSTTLVFVVTRDTVAALDLGLSHEALTAQVDFARSRLASPKESATRRRWRAPLRRLYSQLIAPVEASGLLSGKRRLLIAPHAELHYLPFSALVRAGVPEQLLIERYLIDYVPSASVWLRLRDRSRPRPSQGILAIAPRAAALPGSRSEVAAIKRIYGERAETMVGSPATEAAFRSLAANREIIHLATYGVLNKHNPLFSYVELAKAPDEDGRLEVHEVFGLSLNARLLVLSACQTGLAAGALSDVPPGDDWVGLVQGFLYAGAGNVVATLWPVADVATARLMERFYQELAAGRSESEALAQAQRAALRDGGTAHPFFWAGFALVRGS